MSKITARQRNIRLITRLFASAALVLGGVAVWLLSGTGYVVALLATFIAGINFASAMHEFDDGAP